MRATLCMLLVLGLLTAAPFCAADDPVGSAGDEASTTCVEINPNNTPPVYTYECPDGTSIP